MQRLAMFAASTHAAVMGRRCRRSCARPRPPQRSPVVPVVTVVTADHGAAVVRLVAPGADPDLIPPLISDLRCLRGAGAGKKNQREGNVRTMTLHREPSKQVTLKREKVA